MINKIMEICNKFVEVLKREEQGKTEQEKKEQKEKSGSWVDIMQLLVSAVTLTAFCTISPILAEYQGKKAVYWAAVCIIILLVAVALWESVCLIGRDNWKKFFDGLYDLLRKALGLLHRWFHAPRFIYILPMAVIIGTCAGIAFWQVHTTKSYASIVEIYGIPVGVGEPLSGKDRKNSADYWEIKDYFLRGTMIVTHEDAYHEDEIMGEYSSLYNMAFFQPVDHMVYKYKRNKKKFRSLEDDRAYLAADDNKFREPTKISYYNGTGKLLLEMKKRDENDTFDILTYSVDSEPQLLHSTLLRIPEEGNNKEKQEKDEDITRNATGTSIMSQAIEVTYNSDGLPDRRRISPHIYNLYGVNGERYEYNQNNQMTALYYLDNNGNPICNQKGIMMISFEYDENNRMTGIRYFSDENGEEKIEGFQGVFCEKFEYNADGNLCVRKQLNQSENRWYDKNGVCEYRYTYVGGRLKREEFFDFSGNMADNQNPNVKSTLLEYDEKKDEMGNKVIEISFDSTIRLAEEDASVPMKKTEENGKREDEQNIVSVISTQIIGNREEQESGGKKQVKTEDKQDKNATTPVDKGEDTENKESTAATDAKAADGPSAAGERDAASLNTSQPDVREEELPVRNYTEVHYTVNKHDNILVTGYYQDDQPVKNEQGFSVEQVSYDHELRVEKKTYFDEASEPCLTVDGYSQAIFKYKPASGDEKERIEYRDTDNELAINKREENGYAAVEYKPCEDGENFNGNTTVMLVYYDQSNTPFILPKKGYAKIRQTYNNRGLLIRETYHKEKGGEEDVAYRTDYMVAGIDYEYADDGNRICAVYKDASDQPVNRCDTGFAMQFWEFENGKCRKIHYQGYMDNVLQDVPNKKYGIGCIKYIYANGHNVEEQYFDINGNPVLRSDIGCAVLKKDYNNRGLVAAYSYYGTDGGLILRKDTGYAVLRYQYDELGRESLLHYYGTDQRPIISTEYYCAGMQYQYDEEGNRSDIRYLDVNDNLMIRSDLGYAWVNRKYNADGKVVKERYFDSEGQAVECKEGNYAVYLGFYEDQNLIRKEYKDRNEKFVMRQDEGYAIVEYEYDGDECILERMLGKDKEPVISKKYHCAGFSHSYNEDEEGRQETTWYLDVDGEPMVRSDLGIMCVCKRYDDFGRLVGEDYYDKDTGSQTKPVLCKEGGYASFENKYDERGNCVRTVYRDKEGGLTLRRDEGYAVVKNVFDDLGRCIRVSYYGRDFDIDADNKQMDENVQTDGVQTVNERDADSIQTAAEDQVKHDANQSALVFHAEYGCAEFRYCYDAVGNRTDISYADTDRNVMVRRDLSFARMHREYDGQGNLVTESYYDVNNNPTARREEGYASVKWKYMNGKCIEAVYFDTNGNPVLRKDQGFAIERWLYDELGQCISDAYYDTKGKPVINKKYLCAVFEYEYDNRGYRTDIWYRDMRGEIMVRPDLGYAHEIKEYDNRGNTIRGFYYDDEERLTLTKEGGIAYFEDQYDDQGNCLGGKCYGKNRELKVRKDRGYALCKNVYDRYGQWVAAYYYGTDGKTPILSAAYHCAGIRYEYDEMGDKKSTKYLGLDGNPVIREDLGYAEEKVTTTYDNKTNRVYIKTSFLDCDGQPIAKAEGGYISYKDIYVCGKWVEGRYYTNKSWAKGVLTERNDKGYAIIRNKYDNFGQCISESYYDAEDQPVYCLGEIDRAGNRPELCAEITYEYDVKGNWVKSEYKDTGGNLMVHSDLGYAQVCRDHDEQGSATEERYYDTDRRPMAATPGGYYSMDWIYSDGNCTEYRYFDAEKRLMMLSGENYAIEKDQYDEYGRCILSTYCNADGEPVINEWYECAAFEYRYDELGNKTDIMYRDTEGNLIVRESLGFAWINMKYDEWGRLRVKTYYDADQNPTTDLEGRAEIRYEYNEQGEQKGRFFDLNGVELFAEEG